MIELYHNAMSTCSQKVRFALAEKALAWQGRHLNLRAGDQQQPAYLRLNPNAVVPTLVNAGTVVIESTVINEFIDDAFPSPVLRPEAPAERAKMRLWTKQLDEGLHAATSVISNAIAFRHQKIARGQAAVEQLLANIPDPNKREQQRSTLVDGARSPFFADAVIKFDALFARMDAALADQRWLTGQQFSLADIAYAPYLTRFEHLEMAHMWDDRPRLAAWYQTIKTRKGYQDGLSRWFDADYLALMAEKGGEERDHVRNILNNA